MGDLVGLARNAATWVIESVTARRTVLVRRGRAGRLGKLIAANVDQALAVVSVREPSPSFDVADRLLVLAEACRLRPILVVNKIDLAQGMEIAKRYGRLYRRVGYGVFPVSARTGAGIDELSAAMAGSLSTLIGPSGTGKSSILNSIDPKLARRTGPVSAVGRGMHTTVRSRLLPLPRGGLVADTPGFADIKVWSMVPEELARCFPELGRAGAMCRFRNCAHVSEPGCAVRKAVADESIAGTRYRNYLAAREEALEARSRRGPEVKPPAILIGRS